MGILVSKMGYARVNIELLNNAKITPTGDAEWKTPPDINDGKAITFRFEYDWTNNTTCNISKIRWYPSQYHQDTTTPSNSTWWPLINAAGTSITSGTTKILFASNGVFDQNGKIKLTFGSTVRSINKKLNGCYNGNSLNDGTTAISVTNIQAPQLFGSFEYSYKVRYVDYDENGQNGTWKEVTDTTSTSDYSDIEYFIKIDNIRIPKTSKYQNNVVFTKAGINELIDNIKKYPVTSIEGTAPTGQQPYITVHHGNDSSAAGTKIKVGSIITFPASQSSDSTGTFRVSIDGTESVVTIKGFGSSSSGAINLGGDLIPGVDDAYNIGTLSDINPNASGTQKGRWENLYITGDIGASSSGDRIGTIYATTGNFTNLTVNGNTINATNLNAVVNGSSNTDKVFWRGDKTWSNTLNGPFTVTGVTSISSTAGPNDTTAPTNSNAALICSGAGYFAKNLTASRVFNAVFNDYAECRTTINLAPGHVVIDQDDGSLVCSSKRLQPGAQVISDTYGHLMGATDKATTPIAVAGRVLVYTYQPRENYHAGMAVCSAPDGTVDIMSRAEICEYPDCIVGIVSEIPQYETWGSDNVKVDGRIWIKVR